MDYAPNTESQLEQMRRAIGVGSFDELIASVPVHLRKRLEGPSGLAEAQVIALAEQMSSQNQPLDRLVSFLGAGSYRHLIPTVVDALSSRGEWLTPYTPYQAEASQGILQAIYEFQTMVCELFQMDVANASLYDGASGVAEAALLALKVSGRQRLLVSEAVHPHARQVLGTYLSGTSAVLQEIPTINGVTDLEALEKAMREDVAAVILQQPNVFGILEPMSQASAVTHRHEGLFIASVYPVSLGLIQPPGAYEADIAVGEGRCLGSPIAFGGPGLGLFTATNALMRKVPGRLAGCTVDSEGRRGFTLTLQTREQHIRREKATSNICTNEGWLALRATIFLSLLGSSGIRELAQQNFDKAHYAFSRLAEVPWIEPAFNQPFFNEFALTYDASIDIKRLEKTLAKAGFIAGYPLADWFPMLPQSAVWCVTECIAKEQVDQLVDLLKSFNG